MDDVRTRLHRAQKELERRHAKDESKLQAKFHRRREEEFAAVDHEMKNKWEEAIDELKERHRQKSAKKETASEV